MIPLQTIPTTRLAIGPTSAIGSSIFGSGTPSSMVAIPPKIMSVMLLIAIPFLFGNDRMGEFMHEHPEKRPKATIVPST